MECPHGTGVRTGWPHPTPWTCSLETAATAQGGKASSAGLATPCFLEMPVVAGGVALDPKQWALGPMQLGVVERGAGLGLIQWGGGEEWALAQHGGGEEWAHSSLHPFPTSTLGLGLTRWGGERGVGLPPITMLGLPPPTILSPPPPLPTPLCQVQAQAQPGRGGVEQAQAQA